jgi:hypothetical protein
MSRTTGCRLIGRDGDTYYFVDSVFDHGDGFRGCTGFAVRPVSPGEWEWASEFENVAERLEDVYADMYGGDDRWYDPDSAGDAREKDFERFVNDAIQYDGIGHLMFDESYCCEAGSVFDKLELEYETTDCNGCGRMFKADSDYEELFDLNAWIGVRSFEGGIGTYEWAAKTIFGKVD